MSAPATRSTRETLAWAEAERARLLGIQATAQGIVSSFKPGSPPRAYGPDAPEFRVELVASSTACGYVVASLGPDGRWSLGGAYCSANEIAAAHPETNGTGERRSMRPGETYWLGLTS